MSSAEERNPDSNSNNQEEQKKAVSKQELTPSSLLSILSEAKGVLVTYQKNSGTTDVGLIIDRVAFYIKQVESCLSSHDESDPLKPEKTSQNPGSSSNEETEGRQLK